MAALIQRRSGLLQPFPDWQLSFVVTLAIVLSVLGLLGVIQSLPQESGSATQQSVQQQGPSPPQNFSVPEQKSGASTLGQR